MQYVTLGKTGLTASVVSFGGIPIQRSDAANTKAVVDKLEEYGINYIDTARGYTTSEDFLGQALEGRREKFILATKSMSRDYEGMKQDVETSLTNLRTDYIDLYQFHNLTEKDIDKVFAPGGAWQALDEARQAGKVRHIGVTAHNLEALRRLIEEFSDKIETVMFPYNIIEIQGRQVLTLAKEKGLGVIAMKPLAGGNLDDWKLALRFVAASGVCDISIPGMGSPEEVDRNASAAAELSPLTEAELEQCKAIRKELGQNFCRRCGYCMPCFNGIDIPGCFLMSNYLHKYDLSDWAKARYKAMTFHASSCARCGACEKRCPYGLPIRAMLRQVEKDFGY